FLCIRLKAYLPARKILNEGKNTVLVLFHNCISPTTPGVAGMESYGFQVQAMGVPAGLAVPPIQNQPIVKEGTIWMPIPPSLPNCPPGLEYLTQVPAPFLLPQRTVLTGFETNNKYEIKNTLGQRVYFAAEDTDCCTRNCCGPSRPFTIRIIDNLGHEVITLQRPLRCSSCCFPCCLQELEVQAPPGTPVGYVVQNWHPCLPKFTIQDEKRMDILKIIGPCVVCSCCEDIHFEAISSCPIVCYLGKETDTHLATISFQVVVESDKVSSQPPLLQTKQPQLPQP
uniref:Phospholipid scramblase n=1 Tax=Accipiter nisus TaxID=211598 RepID=A0A8B9MEC2_9AVES